MEARARSGGRSGGHRRGNTTTDINSILKAGVLYNITLVAFTLGLDVARSRRGERSVVR